MLKIPKEALSIIDNRCLPHLEDLRFHQYNLQWLARAIYAQACKDMIQLIQDKPEAIELFK